MAITAAMIKQLRDRTGISITKCKRALEEAQGDMDVAIDNLRKSGAASAVKKAGREANEGLIGFAKNGNAVAIVEVNAETDFVTNNERFREFLENISQEVLNTTPDNVEAFLQQQYSKDSSITIEEYRASLVQAIGENIQIRRTKVLRQGAGHSLGIYQHLGGKIVVVVEMEGDGEEELAKDIAMHTAAAAPDYLSPEQIPADVIAKEREIARSQMEGKKPENIIDKIVDGKLNAFYKDVCLLQQQFVKDDKFSVGALLEQKSKETGKPLKITAFTRWSVGQQ